jgi:ubiquinol-cytochrome c reductase cytochrome b subunit
MAFESIEYITREVHFGYIASYIHINVASFFFLFLYIHLVRNLWYSSYNKTITFIIGITILLCSIATAFLGYTLPEGQMSLWGSTVIINMLSTISPDLLPIVWGSPSPSIATTSRFFVLHYVLPFIVGVLAMIHLLAAHSETHNDTDVIKFHPYFTTKDVLSFVPFLIAILYIAFYYPNVFTHADNYNPANPIVTPLLLYLNGISYHSIRS